MTKWRFPRIGEKNARLRGEEALRERLFSRYRADMGRSPDLDPPALFTERLLWLRLHNRDPFAAVLAQRQQQFEYVRAKACERTLANVYGSYPSYRKVPFRDLPEAVTFRPAHLYGEEFPLRGRDRADVREARKRMKDWTRTRLLAETGDWEYVDACPGILAEEALAERDRVRVLCMDGTPRAFYRPSEPQTLFDAEGRVLAGPDRKPPDCRTQALALSRTLSEGFLFLRVECIDTGDGVRFSEICFTEQTSVARLWPGHVDRELGSFLPIEPRSR